MAGGFFGRSRGKRRALQESSAVDGGDVAKSGSSTTRINQAGPTSDKTRNSEQQPTVTITKTAQPGASKKASKKKGWFSGGQKSGSTDRKKKDKGAFGLQRPSKWTGPTTSSEMDEKFIFEDLQRWQDQQKDDVSASHSIFAKNYNDDEYQTLYDIERRLGACGFVAPTERRDEFVGRIIKCDTDPNTVFMKDQDVSELSL